MVVSVDFFYRITQCWLLGEIGCGCMEYCNCNYHKWKVSIAVDHVHMPPPRLGSMTLYVHTLSESNIIIGLNYFVAD